MRNFFYSNSLWLSMIIGVLGYRWLYVFSPLLPYMIFLMLFFTFCKVDPKDLRLHRWHWAVLAVQLVLSVATYYLLMAVTRDEVVAQGLMMCFIMPTATAAPIIAGKLGGSIQNLTSFTLLSNFATTLVVPAFFPLINPELSEVPASFQFSPFLFHFSLLLSRITPLLLGPFFAAWLLRIGFNAYYRHIDKSTYRHDEKTANPLGGNDCLSDGFADQYASFLFQFSTFNLSVVAPRLFLRLPDSVYGRQNDRPSPAGS